MTHDEIIDYIGTIAKSGTGEFADLLKKANEKKEGLPELIGQFGVGLLFKLYGSRQSRTDKPQGRRRKSLEMVRAMVKAATPGRSRPRNKGTCVILHLKPEDSDDEDFQDFAQEWVLRQVVKKYSDFVGYPIRMKVEKPASIAMKTANPKRAQRRNCDRR
jgi:molecular chaperone HtpG